MTSLSVPPFDNCRGFVVIGYTVACSKSGVSAGIDTRGIYRMRISVDWDPNALANEPSFWLGSTRKGYQHHARTDVGRGPVNIDTEYEGNDAGNGTNDDTQDIADQQAADVADAVEAGAIPPGLISVDTDGGERGACHARIKIWCPKHVDIGNDCAKVRITIVNVGVENMSIAPAPEPSGAGPGWKGGIPGGPSGSAVDGPIEVVPGGTGGRFPQGTLNPYLDEGNDKIEDDKSRPPKSPLPADAERGRRRRRERMERRDLNKMVDQGPHETLWGPPVSAEVGAESTFFFGDQSALAADAPYGVDFRRCAAVRVRNAQSSADRLQALEAAVLAIGVRVVRAQGAMVVLGFTDGRSVAVVGAEFVGGTDAWWHIVFQQKEITQGPILPKDAVVRGTVAYKLRRSIYENACAESGCGALPPGSVATCHNC